MSEELIDAFVKMREDQMLEIAINLLNQEADPMSVLDSANKGLEIVGQLFEAETIFLPELILAGEMMRKLSELILPKIKQERQVEKIGKILMGTVAGDVHDIGKDLVTFMLQVNGFEVMDIGVDVPAADFVAAVKRFHPQVVGLSGLLTLAIEPMKDTVRALETAGLRNGMKIMVGGGQVNEEVCTYVAADAYGADAVAAVKLAKNWIIGE